MNDKGTRARTHTRTHSRTKLEQRMGKENSTYQYLSHFFIQLAAFQQKVFVLGICQEMYVTSVRSSKSLFVFQTQSDVRCRQFLSFPHHVEEEMKSFSDRLTLNGPAIRVFCVQWFPEMRLAECDADENSVRLQDPGHLKKQQSKLCHTDAQGSSDHP